MTLQIILRGVNAIAEFFVGSYIKSSIHDTFIENSGRRSGQFSCSLPLGIRHSCDRAAIHTRRFDAKSEIILSWQAPSCGSGTLIMRATSQLLPRAITKSIELHCHIHLRRLSRRGRERVLSDLSQQATTLGGHATIFNFTASILHQLFIELIRNRDTAEASNMVSPVSRLKIREGLKRGANTAVYKGKATVMEQVSVFCSTPLSNIVFDSQTMDYRWIGGWLMEFQFSRMLRTCRQVKVWACCSMACPWSCHHQSSKLYRRPVPDRFLRTLIKPRKEVSRRQDWRNRRLQCSEEVRSMWEPSVEVSELPKPAAASDSLISDGRYGGNLPHLQMPLPFLYPINARGFGTHDAARKGIEAMDSLGKDDNGIGRLGRVQRSNSDRQAQVLALSKFAQLRGVAQRLIPLDVVLPRLFFLVLRRQAPIWERQDTSVPKQCSLQVSLSTPSGPNCVQTTLSTSARGKDGSSYFTRGGVAFLMHQTVIQDGQRHNNDIRGGTLSKNEKPLLRRRNSFPALPGLTAKPKSKLLDRKDETRFAALARVVGGCLRTFWASNGDFHSHHHTVNQVVWSLDEKQVASCSNDKTVRLWAPQTGQCVRTLVGHDDAVMGCAFSEDGLRLVSSGMDNFLILWNTVNGEMLRRFFGHDDVIYRCVLFRNSSAMLSCSSDRTLKSWFLTPQPPDPPARPAVSDAGQRAAHVAWRAPPAYNDDIVAYKIQWRVGLRVSFKNETTVDGSTFKKQVDGLRPGQELPVPHLCC